MVDQDEFVAANSGIWTAAVIAQIGVAPVAALLAVNVGFGPAFTVNAVSFALSAAVLRGLREPERTRPVSVTSSFSHAREALAALGQIPLLKALAAGQFLAALSAGATSALLVVLAQERLGGPEGFGLIIACIGIGAALGPLLVLRRNTDPRRPLFVFGPYAVRGIVDLVLAAVTALPLAAAALVVYGLSTSNRKRHVQLPGPVPRPRGPTRPGVRRLRRALADRPDDQPTRRRRPARRRRRDSSRLPAPRTPPAGRRWRRSPREQVSSPIAPTATPSGLTDQPEPLLAVTHRPGARNTTQSDTAGHQSAARD